MSHIDRRFQLAASPASLGLRCTSDGVTLAGTPLLRTTVAGLAPRSTGDLSALFKAAYGRDLDAEALSRGLTVVAKALNDGDLGRAMVASVRLRLSDVDSAAAQQLAATDETLAKGYNPQEPRDWRGRWTTGGGAGPAASQPSTAKPSRAAVKPSRPAPAQPPASVFQTRPYYPSTAPCGPGPQATGVPDPSAVAAAYRRLLPAFESQFDRLGPVEFAKRVNRFAYWVEVQAHQGQAFDRAGAKAEYQFLQDRVSFWLGYQYKSPGSHANILGAGLQLYEGAINAGLIRVGDPDDWPKSVAQAVAFASTLDGSASGRGIPFKGHVSEDAGEIDPHMPWMSERTSGIGGVVENAKVGIKWGGGIKEQGYPFEHYLAAHLSSRYLHTPEANTWDFFDAESGEAISAKTLDTTTYSYAAKPNRVYSTLKSYIDKAAGYGNGQLRGWDVDPAAVATKQIQLAVPEETSPAQWDALISAQHYAESRGVGFVVTRIR